ncbi:MAG: TIGR02301 family protein [Bauldia sp.]
MARSKQWRLLAALLAAVIALSIPAGQAPRAQEADPTALPYDTQMLRLSEILGALHYLRRLCDSREGGRWRDQMEALIAAEQPDELRQARMVDRFNRGYESFRSVYRACTPAAEVAVGRYVDEGARIAADITARFGKTE